MPHLSVVIPVYKAEKILTELHRRLAESLSSITADYEIVLVEDCGRDGSWAVIENLAARDPRVRGVKLSRNFGQHPAITAGLDLADGDWVVVMDCDLQDPPEEIPKLYNRAIEGFDIVIGRRADRQDGFWKKTTSRAFYRVFSYLSGLRNDGAAANFRILSRKAIDAFRRMRERHRFFISLVDWMGFSTDYIDVAHSARYEGKTSYSILKLIRLAADTVISHSDMPLKLAIFIGLFISVVSFIIGGFYFVLTMIEGASVAGWPSLFVSIYFLGGLNLMFMGVLGLYLARTFDEVKGRPIYLIDRTTGGAPVLPWGAMHTSEHR